MRRPVDEVVDEIVRIVALPRKRVGANARGGRGVDLSDKRAELRSLIRTCRDGYDLKLEDWNWRAEKRRFPMGKVAPEWLPYAAEGEAERQAVEEMCRRPVGRPGLSPQGLAVGPLRGAYYECRDFWGRGYRPEDIDVYDTMEWHHPSGRLLLLVAQDCDARFEPTTIKNLAESLRKAE